MTCERCGQPISETHICTPTLGYLERELMQLKIKTEHLEKLLGIGDSQGASTQLRNYRVVYYWTCDRTGGAITQSMKLAAYDARDAHYRADLLKKPSQDRYYRVLDIFPWED